MPFLGPKRSQWSTQKIRQNMSQLRSTRPKWCIYCANLQFFVDVWGNKVSTIWSSLTWTQFRFSFADLFLDLGQPYLVTAFKQHKRYNQTSLGLREQVGEHSIIVESNYRNSRNKQTLLDLAAQKIETNLLTLARLVAILRSSGCAWTRIDRKHLGRGVPCKDGVFPAARG